MDGLPSSENVAAYNRAKKRRPTENAENTEVWMTEIDAPGIKKCRKHGSGDDRDRCRRLPISKRARNKTYLHIFTPCHKHFSYSVFSACSVGRPLISPTHSTRPVPDHADLLVIIDCLRSARVRAHDRVGDLSGSQRGFGLIGDRVHACFLPGA
jgi:hypothetical protein